jgi:hypothetical protein
MPVARAQAMPAVVALGTAVLMPLAAAAFWPHYLGSTRTATDVFSHVHAALGLAWLLTLISQSLLIRAGRRPLHRAIGRIVYVLGPAFVVSSILLAHSRFSRMPPEVFAREAHSLYLPLSMTLLFAVALALGVWWRAAMPIHARFMASTAIFFVDPVLGRILYFYFPPLPSPLLYQAITFSTIVALLLLLWRSIDAGRAGRAAFAAFTAFTALLLSLYFGAAQGSGWSAFAAWFRTLPLT